jgi:hypothetical protein
MDIYSSNLDRKTVLNQSKYIDKHLNITTENIPKDLETVLKKFNIVLFNDFNTFFITSII